MDKFDHKNYDSLFTKIEVLKHQGKFKQIKDILNDLKEFHPEREEEITNLQKELVEKFNAQVAREREVYQKMFGGADKEPESESKAE